ncbi:MAG TPA: PAC2 family protein [Pseudonocardiaceae bacterium]|nr:PAC2 family protein [Pseudonocardiaceae bacterium]
MVLDPEELYEVDSDVPDLTGAVLLHHFEGFMDAGSAGRLTAEHLLNTFEHRVIARFDVDRLIDYRSKRPMMTYVTDHWAEYQAPELVVHLMHDPEGPPFLLFTGPEPDHEWERFAAAVRTLNERWGIRLTVGMHGIPMGVPHTRPLGVTGHATRAELVGDFQPVLNRLQVPGSISALLEFRLGEAGHDAVGFAAHVPHYLAQASYPAAAVVLLGAVARVTDLHFPDDALRAAANRADIEINRQVNGSDEVGDVVRALEEQYDRFAEGAGRGSLLAEGFDRMPTAEELGSEFERFLAEQQGNTDQ